MRPETLIGLLAQPDRLRVYAAVVLGAGTPSQVAAATGLSARAVVQALRRLEQGGLLRTAGGVFEADLEMFSQSFRTSGEDRPPAEPMDPDRDRDLVLRTFIRDGRLVRIPAVRGKRRIVLEHIAACFEVGVRYPEPAVDTILRQWHDDYVSLRRFLVDEVLLTREAGLYWRSGGHVPV